MKFGAPYWLWALAILPLLIFLFFGNERRRRTLLQKIVSPRLLDQLAGSGSPGRRRLRFGLLLLGIASVIVSLAQPQFGYTWEQSKRSGRDVFIAIDTSKSMLSADVAPNRLTRAKLAAQDLVMQLQGDRAGVLAFAGDAFLQTPLTIDYNATLDSINDLSTDTVPRGGTDIAAVINEAARAFGKGESEDRALILFTDGEELDADGVAAARAQAGNFRIFTVGVGTQEGSIIPVSTGDEGTSFVKDPDGQIVKSKLDENRLKQIADATDGFYTHLQNGPEDMKRIVQEGLGKMREHDIDARMSRRPIERYQWPLALGLALIAASMFISERRREKWKAKGETRLLGRTRSKGGNGIARAAIVLLAALAGVHSACGLPANQGIELYNDKKYKESYDSFNQQLMRNPDSQALEFDSGAAAYKSGDFDKAIDAFGKATTSSKPEVREKAEYNLGNALCIRGAMQEAKETKLKDWNNALQHYDEALKIDPKNADAKYNRDVVAKLIDQLNQKQTPSPKQENKDQQKDQDQKNQQEQKNNQQQNPQNQQKNDQNSGEGKNQQQDKQNSGEKSQENPKDGGNPQNNQQNQQQQPQNQGAQNPQTGQEKSGQQQQSSQNQNPGQSGSQQENATNPSGDQSQSPQPTPSPSDQSGGNSTGKIQPGEQSQNAGQGKAYAPGQEREMTPAEAARVVEAEKDEEAKGVLNEHKTSAPVLRDW